MEISSLIAQEIVLQLKNVISQEINFMNSQSLIIASTDKSRIGVFHSGAAKVIASKKPLIIDDATSYPGSKQGINMPIVLEDQIVGVVGITGERCKVERNGTIIKKMTEILIKEDYIKDVNLKKHDRSRYIISRILNQHLSEFSNQSADIFYYNYDVPHHCIIGEFQTAINYHYEKLYRIIQTLTQNNDEFIDVIIDHKLYLFIPESYNFHVTSLLRKISDKVSAEFNVPFYFGIGLVSHSLSSAKQSFEYALNALEWNKVHKEEPFFHFSNMDIGLLLTSMDKKRISLIHTKVLRSIPENEYEDLKEVLLTYGEMNKSIIKCAEKLYIHKNSFQYKLNKITQYTGYDPKVLNDYVCLYIAFLLDAVEPQ